MLLLAILFSFLAVDQSLISGQIKLL